MQACSGGSPGRNVNGHTFFHGHLLRCALCNSLWLYQDPFLVRAHARTAQEGRLKRIISESQSVRTHGAEILLGCLRLHVGARLGEAGSPGCSALRPNHRALCPVKRSQNSSTELSYPSNLPGTLNPGPFPVPVKDLTQILFQKHFFLDGFKSRYKVLLPMLSASLQGCSTGDHTCISISSWLPGNNDVFHGLHD